MHVYKIKHLYMFVQEYDSVSTDLCLLPDTFVTHKHFQLKWKCAQRVECGHSAQPTALTSTTLWIVLSSAGAINVLITSNSIFSPYVCCEKPFLKGWSEWKNGSGSILRCHYEALKLKSWGTCPEFSSWIGLFHIKCTVSHRVTLGK